MKTSLLPAAAALLLAGTACDSRPAAATPEPIRLIVETDMGNDIDDALAFDLIYKAMDDGRVDLLAIGNHKLSPTATDYIDILNTWYGYPDIPLAQSPTPVLNDHAPDYTAAVCALIGSAVGTELAALISEQTLETLMLVALPCVAVFLSVKKDFGRDIPAEERPVYTPRQELLRSALIGLVFGCYDGLVGPGTGTFMILGFTALLSLDLITAGGCAKASNLASCAASAVVWILHGQVLWALAIPALACSIAGNYLGALYAIRGGSKKIRSVMFLVLGLLFVKMLYELLF